jgi:bacteriocin-like protein
MNELTIDELDVVSGGGWMRGLGYIGVVATIAEGLYEFYEGYSDHRN